VRPEVARDRRVGQAGGEQAEQRGLVLAWPLRRRGQFAVRVDGDRPFPHQLEQRDQRVEHRGGTDHEGRFGAAAHVERDQSQLVVGDEQLHGHALGDSRLFPGRDHRTEGGGPSGLGESGRVIDGPVGDPGGQHLRLNRVGRTRRRQVRRPVEAPHLVARRTLQLLPAPHRPLTRGHDLDSLVRLGGHPCLPVPGGQLRHR
jgi:hypothetical protein